VKKVLRFCASIIKWIIIGVICVEVLSFLVITVLNYVLWGHAREGSRAVYDPYTLFLQAHGVRDTAYNSHSQEPGRNVVIWCFGGSTMRGSTPDDDKTIPSQLAKLLNENTEGRHYTVINFGMNSFNSLLETKYLQKAFIERSDRPDLVIFYDGANDSTYFVAYHHPYGHYGFRRTSALIESYYRSWFGLLKPVNAAVYSSFTKELYDKITEITVPVSPDSAELKEMVDATAKRYAHVNKLVSCYGAQFLLFWQPMIWMESCQAPASVRDKEKGLLVNSDRFATARKNFSLPYLGLTEKLKDRPYFVNIRDVLCTRNEPVYQPDGVHLLDRGREMVAQQMAQVIRERLRSEPRPSR
jgi:lysophospholipase L1-like esterase